MNVFIIGEGLIGGSMALDIKLHFSDAVIFGIDKNAQHLQMALELQLIDHVAKLEELHLAEIVIVAIPVDTICSLLPTVLDLISDKTLVFDVGSIKKNICESVENHPKRGNFLATHPIAGTEFSGPKAAVKGLFKDKVQIICEPNKTRAELLNKVLLLFQKLSMNIVYMDPEEHDKHIAYSSHLPHVCAFMLGKTVLEKEKNEKGILNLAGSGFASTARLAKSSPEMWTPIFMDNKLNVIEALDEYIINLTCFKNSLVKEDSETLFNEMKNTNRINKILHNIDSKLSE